MAGYNDSVKSANVITGILSNATLQGDSAYEVAVKNGFVGTEAEWLASLKGDQGDQGIQGPIGPTGPTGATGNGISTIDMGSSGWMSIHTTDGTDYSFYVKGDKGNKGDTGVGISTVLLNSDYTLTITLTDGDTYTTDPIRGAKGETGTGITDVELNSDYTLTITMSDGTFYTTGSIRGAKGDKGDTGSKGDKGTSISSVTKTGTSGLVDTYTITYDDNTTSTFTVTNGQNATVEVTSDTDSDYRLTFTDVNGSIETPNLYSDVTASAKQLLSESYTEDKVPYLFRKSPNSDRAVESIVGGTVGWNQLVQNGDFSDGANGWKASAETTLTVSNNTGIVTAVNISNPMARPLSFSVVEGHKYLFLETITPQASTTTTRVVLHNGTNTVYNIPIGSIASGTKYLFERVVTFEQDYTTLQFRTYFNYNSATSGDTYHLNNVQAFDLTTMFGSTIADYIYSIETATAGAGVAKLKEWGFFTEDYYEYCEPTLKSVEGLVRKKTVGFNQWDEEWEVGTINSDGSLIASSSSIRTKNFIHVIPSTRYYINNSNFSSVYGYDEDKNFVVRGFYAGAGDNIGWYFDIPSNVHYIKVSFTASYGTTYNHDICINLSDPTRNGQYEPYESHSYPLDSEVVLRGIPKLDSNNNLYYDGDVYPADGQGKRRYGLVDLGTLDWNYLTNYTAFMAIITGIKRPSAWNTTAPKLSVVYKNMDFTSWESTDNLTMASPPNADTVFVKNSAYTDAATFKTAMSGIYLLYELATHTTFTALPYHNPQIVGDTEEWVTTGIVPVGHNTRYYQNLRKKIEGLPWNFSSLIAPTEVTNKATRNYTTGSYLILNNILYKVTANIANGGNITPNTNCTATTIMAEFMSL